MSAFVAGSPNMVQVWDLATGQPVGTSMPHPGDEFGLWSVAFSPDGQKLATGHKDGQARLWNWQTGQLIGNPMQHVDEVHDVRFTQDGRQLVTCVRLNQLQIWDVATGKIAVPEIPGIIALGNSAGSTAITTDRLIVSSGHWYSLVDLSLLQQKPTTEQLNDRADTICKTTSLMPSELNRAPLPVKPLVEFIDKNPNEAYFQGWYGAVLALTAYRDGDFQQSADWAEKSLTKSQRKDEVGVLALIVLSMAQHQKSPSLHKSHSPKRRRSSRRAWRSTVASATPAHSQSPTRTPLETGSSPKPSSAKPRC